jgi:hypothetical protein
MLWRVVSLGVSAVIILSSMAAAAESSAQRGKRLVDECLAALGGDRFLAMQDRVETGRAYSFYREQLSGLSIARVYTRYLDRAAPGELAVRERQAFGKKEDNWVVFLDKEAYEVTFRGARPLAADRFDRYRESTRRNILYILRERFREPGLTFESQGADVLDNRPVEIVNVTDGDNLTTTVYFDQTTKLPIRQMFFRRDPVTKDRDEEMTLFAKYRDAGGGVMWPFDVQRNRNGEKIYQIFADNVKINQNLPDTLFMLPSGVKLLKQP